MVYLNFKQEESLKDDFKGDLKPDSILLYLSMLIPDFHATPYKTLISMDEIQECPNARSSLKYFCLDKRYDVLATRSLLGIKGYNREDSRGPSVGFETMNDMKPMDFEEFLEAKKTPDAILQKVKDCYMTLSSVPEAIHNFMLKSFNEYLIVG